MPADDLEPRLHAAVRQVALSVSLANVPMGRVYVRDVLAWNRERDGVPCVIIARTPGRGFTRTKRLTWVDWVFPVTCLLLASQGGKVATDEPWRAAWAPALIEALDDADLAPEAVNVDPDALTVLDLSAFDAAGLWRSSVSVLISCRTPYPPR